MPPTTAVTDDPRTDHRSPAARLIGSADGRVERHPTETVLGTRTGDGADDPVTGPMPAVSLAGGRVRVTLDKGATIVALDGGLDVDVADELANVVTRALDEAEAAVLDVEQLTLLDQSAFETVVRAFEDATADVDRCIVAPRLSGRLVLERWGVAGRVALFMSVADALQARAFEACGYGEGWTPGSGPSR